MNPDTNLQFISEKIAELRNAVMYSMSQSLVKLPNDVISFVRIDEDNYLWFLSHLPLQSLKECEQVFPARLHFFKKGCDFFVEVSGKATIVSDISSSKMVLIKMTMNNIEYTEPHAKKAKTKVQLLAEKSYKWVLRNVGFHGSSLGNLHQSH